MRNQNEVLRQPFDVEIHKETFINYLEVIIDSEGTVMYATPSHQEKLLAIACRRLNVDRQTLYDMCPQEYYFNVLGWLTSLTKCIAVYNEFHVGEANERQREVLQTLANEGLYRGLI